jgi:hypothetical protein
MYRDEYMEARGFEFVLRPVSTEQSDLCAGFLSADWESKRRSLFLRSGLRPGFEGHKVGWNEGYAVGC